MLLTVHQENLVELAWWQKYIADQFEGELYDLAIEELPLYNGEESQRDLEAVKN